MPRLESERNLVSVIAHPRLVVSRSTPPTRRPRRRSRRRHHGLRSGPRRPAPSAGTGRPSSATRSCATSSPKSKLEELLGASRHRQPDDHRPLRRQQQLVRRLGVLAAEDLRPRGRPHHGRRPQEVAGRRTRAEHRRRRRSPRRPTRRSDARLLAARVPARSAEGARRQDARRSSTCAARRSSPARSSRRPDCPRPASAAATSPAPKSIPWAKACNDDGTFKSCRRAEGAVRRRRA